MFKMKCAKERKEKEKKEKKNNNNKKRSKNNKSPNLFLRDYRRKSGVGKMNETAISQREITPASLLKL